jgi:hypothetical protein
MVVRGHGFLIDQSRISGELWDQNNVAPLALNKVRQRWRVHYFQTVGVAVAQFALRPSAFCTRIWQSQVR